MTANGSESGKGNESGCVLITGASSGIGKEFAKVFAEEGFDLVLLARSRDKLRDLGQELKAMHGIKATVIPADLGDPGTPQAVFDSLRERQIDIDILVNNAGVMVESAFATPALADHLHLLHVNIVALTALTGLFLEPMLRRGHGRILNVASVAAFLPVPHLSTYGASKAYVRSFSEAVSQELTGTGVTVTAVCPGFTDTDMVHASALATRLPSLMVMDAKSVAKEGYRACLGGEALHVTGVSNDLFTQAVQYLPRSLVRAMGGWAARQWT
jgi:short-subunit dehydrogenase